MGGHTGHCSGRAPGVLWGDTHSFIAKGRRLGGRRVTERRHRAGVLDKLTWQDSC